MATVGFKGLNFVAQPSQKSNSQISSWRESHLRTTGCHQIRCHTILLAAQRAHPALTTASKADTRFTYTGGMEGW